MAWIESHQSLKEHPKLYKLMELTKMSRPEAIGYLHMLWWWAIDYAQDGDLSNFSKLQIARAIGWGADPEQLINALIEARFLDTEKTARGRNVDGTWLAENDNQQGLWIHDWQDFCGDLIKKRIDRASARRRKLSAKRRRNSAYQPTNQQSPTNSHQPTKDSDPRAIELTQKLVDRIQARLPDWSPPTAAQLTKWAHVCELMHRRDGHSYELIAEMIDWAMGHDFWAGNTLSMEGLRRHWNSMTAQRARGADDKVKRSLLRIATAKLE
ncbi:MAG TPA: hypothetical protein VNL14_16425 [Candidatus Acidoferrales bacterium]|nr:hypothetical protein [Candidatus Acidoferrales bacterium]